ncbi:MAG: uroporphyrinogen-III C-methyltransferase, partial [Candidatus Omnitrophica bacterium]|nr:uroporphyrinogen-III C-methyltransferase [Candidatus Omnitrophota bacterium]
MSNKVYLIGAGPGNPDLITVRGRRILRQADVIVYDYLVDKSVLGEAKESAALICSDELGKTSHLEGIFLSQNKINNLIVREAKKNKKVVRLKNGDPSIFGRASSELDALIKNKIDFEIVPGVTAASAASAFSGIPLTDRNFASSCAFVTGHEGHFKKESSIDYKSIAKAGTIVLYMAVRNLEKIANNLIAAGKPETTPVAIVKNASLPNQKLILGTLSTIAKKAKEKKITPPAIIIIGEVAALEKKYNWLKKAKRVLFTGISPERFFTKEAVFHLPLIKIVPLDDYSQMDTLLKEISNYDWLVFTSRYGVRYFFERLFSISYDTRVLKGINIAAIGASTKECLKAFGVLADLVPKEESSYGLINAFKKEAIKHKRVFIPRSDLSDKGLKQALEAQGADVTACLAYKNIMAKNLPDLDLRFFDEVMFTSPST